MKKASFITLGCRVNQYETQCVREEICKNGFEEASFDDVCDLYFINTCAVTGESARKGRQMIRRAVRGKEKNPESVICVCGCLAQGGEEMEDLLPSIDVLAGNTGKNKLASLILSVCDVPLKERRQIDLREDISRPRAYEPMGLSTSRNARAFVKIEDGCNSFCAYCYVPFVRGRVRSRSVEEIRKEVLSLSEGSFHEIVLTGIETGSWGEDFPGKPDLCDLVENLAQIPGIERIRFGSLKPSLFQEDFCRRLSLTLKVMPHFHLSLQSGSSRVLDRMGRSYDREAEIQAFRNIRRYFPDVGLSADFICGFPGETEEDFADTVSLVQEINLLHTHIFPFSPRKGTRAAAMDDQIPEEIKRHRCARLLEVAKESSRSFAEKRAGKKYRVLCERVRDGAMFGYTENFIYTRTPLKDGASVGSCYEVLLGKQCRFSVETMTVFTEMLGNG